MSRFAALLASLLAFPSGASAAAIKFATLAPEGSTWMKVMHELAEEVDKKTGGALTFRFYAGGVSGDERDVVRKIRIGQLHAAGFTGVGLGEIAPMVRLLDAPFLVASAEEADFLVQRFDADFHKAFEENGYVLLGWAEVGLVYLFTGKPVASVEDLRGLKMWVWDGDPMAEALFSALDVNPIPLSVPDVRSSLETGLINGVYGSPMAVIALQWYQKARYRHSVPYTNANGAVVISKAFFETLPPAQRKILQVAASSHLRRLTEAGRRENAEALKTLEAQGVKTVSPASPSVVETYRAAGTAARRSLAGRVYPRALLERAERSLQEYREGAAAARDGSPPAPR